MDGHPSLAHGNDTFDLHVAQVRFGGDFGLQPGSHWLAEHIAQYAESHCEGQQPKSSSDRFLIRLAGTRPGFRPEAWW